MGFFNKKYENDNFHKEYKISGKLLKESTVNHITKGKIPTKTGIYNNGIIYIRY